MGAEGDPSPPEDTLDPPDDAAWEDFRRLAHQMLDDAIDYQRGLRSRPVWQPIPSEVKDVLRMPIPRVGRDLQDIYGDFLSAVLPYSYGNVHPRHWGWVNGQGTPLAVMADMFASAMNPNCFGGEHAASYVEAQVLDWLREALWLPEQFGGVLVSGGSMANLVGMAAARERCLGAPVAMRGVFGLPGQPVLYASTEVHNSVDKAAGILGLGFDQIRKIPVDPAFRIEVGELAKRIRSDRAEGMLPFCIVANVGTVNTGAIDPLGELVELCHEESLWLHVDGAFGALVATSPKLRPLVRQLEAADSIAFDLHKWLYLPADIGCVLVRDRGTLARSFSREADYLESFDRGITAGAHRFSHLGPELTRSFRALKAWMCLQAYGFDRLALLIEQNVEQAQYLEHLVAIAPELELLAPVSLNIVCFRYSGGASGDTGVLNTLNRELLIRLWESGVAVVSSTMLGGTFSLRAAITNHRTRTADLVLLVETVVGLGRELEDSGVVEIESARR